MVYQRDPVSTLLDRGARSLLERAYGARRGQWVMTRLADPSDRHRQWAMGRYGIDVDGPDNAPTISGRRLNAHTRWGRAFMRALWYNHRHYGPERGSRAHTSYLQSEKRAAKQFERTAGMRSERRMTPITIPLQVEWGRRMPAVGVIPAGRAVRVRVAYGGQTARRVVRSKPDRDRIWTDEGDPAGRWAVAERRDWG